MGTKITIISNHSFVKTNCGYIGYPSIFIHIVIITALVQYLLGVTVKALNFTC